MPVPGGLPALARMFRSLKLRNLAPLPDCLEGLATAAGQERNRVQARRRQGVDRRRRSPGRTESLCRCPRYSRTGSHLPTYCTVGRYIRVAIIRPAIGVCLAGTFQGSRSRRWAVRGFEHFPPSFRQHTAGRTCSRRAGASRSRRIRDQPRTQRRTPGTIALTASDIGPYCGGACRDRLLAILSTVVLLPGKVRGFQQPGKSRQSRTEGYWSIFPSSACPIHGWPELASCK